MVLQVPGSGSAFVFFFLPFYSSVAFLRRSVRILRHDLYRCNRSWSGKHFSSKRIKYVIRRTQFSTCAVEVNLVGRGRLVPCVRSASPVSDRLQYGKLCTCCVLNDSMKIFSKIVLFCCSLGTASAARALFPSSDAGNFHHPPPTTCNQSTTHTTQQKMHFQRRRGRWVCTV